MFSVRVSKRPAAVFTPWSTTCLTNIFHFQCSKHQMNQIISHVDCTVFCQVTAKILTTCPFSRRSHWKLSLRATGVENPLFSVGKYLTSHDIKSFCGRVTKQVILSKKNSKFSGDKKKPHIFFRLSTGKVGFPFVQTAHFSEFLLATKQSKTEVSVLRCRALVGSLFWVVCEILVCTEQ